MGKIIFFYKKERGGEVEADFKRIYAALARTSNNHII